MQLPRRILFLCTGNSCRSIIAEALINSRGEGRYRAVSAGFRVLDRGKGIDDEIRDSVFEAFVSSSSVVGRGMGLTIARHSANCLGGTISLEDREGGGAQAVVTLPLEEEEPSSNE